MNIIVACNQDGLIGIKQRGQYSLPWSYLKEDMEFFKKTTLGTSEKPNICIMGYNTWMTLPASYKKETGRINLVIANPFKLDNTYSCFYYQSFKIAYEHAVCSGNEIFVIGGAHIYASALEYPIKNIYLTVIVNKSYPDIGVVVN